MNDVTISIQPHTISRRRRKFRVIHVLSRDGSESSRFSYFPNGRGDRDCGSGSAPEGIGRVIVALAGDPELLSLTGQTLEVGALATRWIREPRSVRPNIRDAAVQLLTAQGCRRFAGRLSRR
jgi:hypothetical protein